jgi:hypothetical protein
MSETPLTFRVVLHHLAPDARKAGVELPEAQLDDISAARLSALIEALARLAPEVEYPALPEMRITDGKQQYLVQVRERRVRFSSWALRSGGCDLTPAEIIAAIAGTELSQTPETREPAAGHRESWRSRCGLIALLAVGILGSNLITAWVVMDRTTEWPAALRPPYRLLEKEPGRRMLERVAGVYATGDADGDRQLTLRADSSILWAQLGPNRTVVEETPLTALAAEANGRPALLLASGLLIECRDAQTLVYLGDTYTRVSR